jgi:hypothetical protein
VSKGRHVAKRELPRPNLRLVVFGIRNRLNYMAYKRKNK